MKNPMTHTVKYSKYNRYKTIKVRETKLYWIGMNGTKFSKKYNGLVTGDWPSESIDLDTLKPIKSPWCELSESL